MGDVVSFPKPCTPTEFQMPEWRLVLQNSYWNLANWKVSVRGNPFLRIGVAGGAEHCVTTFRRKDGWSWCIATDARHAPLWSERNYFDEEAARAAAWDALIRLIEPEGGER